MQTNVKIEDFSVFFEDFSAILGAEKSSRLPEKSLEKKAKFIYFQ